MLLLIKIRRYSNSLRLNVTIIYLSIIKFNSLSFEFSWFKKTANRRLFSPSDFLRNKYRYDMASFHFQYHSITYHFTLLLYFTIYLLTIYELCINCVLIISSNNLFVVGTHLHSKTYYEHNHRLFIIPPYFKITYFFSSIRQ